MAQHDELLEELLSLKPSARVLRMLELGMVPLAGGAGAGDGDADGDGDDADAGAGDGGDGDGADGADGAGDGAGDGADDIGKLREELRKHRGTERRAKTAEQRARELETKLKEFEDRDKTEQEKAIERAREEARNEVLTEAEKERRSDRLEVAVTRLAARGITVKDGDEEKTLKFADPEDALVFIERAIAKGDLDPADVFDDKGKVNTEFVTDELADLLARKPRLAATGGNDTGSRETAGDADAGRGRAANAGTPSVEQELARIRRHKS